MPDDHPHNADASADGSGVPATDGAAIPGPDQDATGETFPIVGIGASAGGLRAFLDFFSALPAQPGMAFVLVQHLSPDHESALAEIVQAETQMAVDQVTDQARVRPDCVYAIPPGKHLEIHGGHLELVELERQRSGASAVDHFFRALANDVGPRAVGVVLSGTGTDGTLGLKAIKERGGLTLAQDPESAGYDGMPRSAIHTGLVDVTGTPAELADRLVSVRQLDLDLPTSDGDGDQADGDEHALRAIFSHLRQRTGHDFTHYKRSTILRRLARRLQVNDIETLSGYAGFLRQSPEESGALLRDFLISVTQFFRDAQAFDALEREVVPGLFREGRREVRVWVPGCATGEEAYSLAMILCEHASRLEPPPSVQVFATDIDEEALAVAREGFYPNAAAADVPPERLARFFDQEAEGVRVKAGLRETVLFATHNLVADPPFSRLDLVSCRNVLIYFNREIQERAFATFHYALRPGGYLFLGLSESPETVSTGFVDVEKRVRLYRRRDVPQAARSVSFSSASARTQTPPHRASPERSRASSGDALLDRYNEWTLETYAPPRLLVDEHYDLTHVLGGASAYLRHREGPVTANVLDQVRRAFRLDLRTALFRAFAKGESVDTAFREVEVEGEARVVRLHVGPVRGAAASDGLAEVVFIELDPASVELLGPPRVDSDDTSDPTVARLEEELHTARSRLQSIIEQQEVSNEELTASNEELQSTNEELQSTTEELETSKEELQSMNEELTTVNQELKNKVEELTRSNSDLQNLMASTEVAILFLDRNLRLNRYTPSASALFNLIPSDVGRPFDHVSHKVDHGDLGGVARRVLETLRPAEETVASENGQTFLFRAHPYRTLDDRIDGVVFTFVDVTEVEAAKRAAAARAEQQSVVSELGEHALQGVPTATLFDDAVQRVREVLRADACKVLRYEPDAHQLRLVAGVGWKSGLIGTATVPDRTDSQAGYTLVVREPVLVPDLGTEARFTAPSLLSDHQLKSGMSVVIPSPSGEHPFGVLGVHCGDCRSYTVEDGHFLQAVANVLADAIEQERKSATIRQQFQEIEAVYEAAPVGLAFLDRDLVYRRVNARLAAFNGVPVEGHLGRRIGEVIPAVAEEIEPQLRRVVEEGEPLEDLEVRGYTPGSPDQERVWLCSYVPQRNESGEVEGINVVVRDVTVRTEQAAALAQAAVQIELAVDGGGLGMWSFEAETGEVHYDERSARLLGVGRRQSLGEALATVHPEDRSAVEGQIREAVRESGSGVFEVTYRQGNADPPRWVTLRARVQFEGEGIARRVLRADGVVVDVSALKAAEEQVRQQLAEIQSYFQAIPVGVAVLDAESRYVRVNDRLTELVGRPADELIGHRPADLLPPDHVAMNQPHVDHVLATGEPVLNVEVRASVPASGPAEGSEEGDWLVSFHPVESGGLVRGVCVVLHDVTALKRAQDELAALAAELERRVTVRTQEVRRLAADLTEAEQRERRRVAQVLHDDLQQILYALQVKLHLVTRALDTEAGPAALLEEAEELLDSAIHSTRTLTVDLSPPVLRGEGLDRTLEWLAHRMQQAYSLRVEVASPGSVDVGSNVHVLLYQVVRELLFNVVKHAGVDQARIELSAADGRVRVVVEDEGAGFDGRNDSGGGGFGLFSVRERLQLAGGDLRLSSEPGQGTRATVTCPAHM